MTTLFTQSKLPDVIVSDFSKSVTFSSGNSAFVYSKHKAAKNVVILTGGALIGASAGVLSFQSVSYAAPDPNVQAVVAVITDTIPIISGIAMLVLSAGLAPWAARTCLSWLSSIIRGAI